MKGIPMKKFLGSVAAITAALAVAVLAPSAASADPGYHAGGVGSVCGANPGEIVRVTQPTFNNPWESPSFADAAAHLAETGDAAGASAIRAQIDLNAGVTQAHIVGDREVTYRARAGADGCVSVPATGYATTTVTVRTTSGKSGVAKFTPAMSWDGKDIAWSDAVSTSGAVSADIREITQRNALRADLGYSLDIK